MSTYTWKPVALHLCLLLQREGFTLDRADNGEESVTPGDNLGAFVDCLTACDEAWLFVSRPFVNGGQKKLRLYLVFGNEPHETVADYSVDEKLEATLELFEEFWSRRKTPLAESEASWVEEIRNLLGKPGGEPTRQELHDRVVANVLTEVADKATPPAERPTPITDRHRNRINSVIGEVVPSHVCADLERQLAERTEQRDMLVEALEGLVMCWDRDESPQGSHRQKARKALAAVKGGLQ